MRRPRGSSKRQPTGTDIHIVAQRRRKDADPEEYASKEEEQREDNHIPPGVPILFLEVDVEDASEFEDVLEVRGVEIGGHKVLRAVSSVVPNAIAALLLHLRDETRSEERRVGEECRPRWSPYH